MKNKVFRRFLRRKVSVVAAIILLGSCQEFIVPRGGRVLRPCHFSGTL